MRDGILFSITKEMMTFVTTWIELENIILIKTNQGRNTNTTCSHLSLESKTTQLIL
jgi:hypothetical protein